MLWRLQGMTVFITVVLLFLLPLALPVRLALYGLLSLLAVGLVLQSRDKPEFKSLTIDTDAQTVSINYSSSGSGSASGGDLEQNPQEGTTIAKPLGCRVEYFSQRLIMLAYCQPGDNYFQRSYLHRYRRLSVFPTMLSNDDYRRLLAVVRLVQTR